MDTLKRADSHAAIGVMVWHDGRLRVRDCFERILRDHQNQELSFLLSVHYDLMIDENQKHELATSTTGYKKLHCHHTTLPSFDT